MILFLLDVCKFRVGTEEYKKKYKTYGATTINKDYYYLVMVRFKYNL